MKSTNNTKPIFTITRALPKQCAACDRFTDYVEQKLKSRLSKDSRFTVIDIVRSNEGDFSLAGDKNTSLHPDFHKFITWWPNFIIFNPDSWYDHSKPLTGYIYGGYMNYTDMTPKETPGEYDIKSADTIMSWAEGVLALGTFHKNRQIRYRPYIDSWNRSPMRYGRGYDSDYQ